MASRVGPAEHLKGFGVEVVVNAPEVGANLHAHCDYVANLRARGPSLFGLAWPVLARGAGELVDFLRHGGDGNGEAWRTRDGISVPGTLLSSSNL
jgi:choline dehydrogenase-like flavoprotein